MIGKGKGEGKEWGQEGLQLGPSIPAPTIRRIALDDTSKCARLSLSAPLPALSGVKIVQTEQEKQAEDIVLLFSIDSAKAGYALNALLKLAAQTDSGNGPTIFLTIEDLNK